MIPFPNKKYNIIYADPPWSYKGKMMNSSVTDHYSVMTINDICNLPVKKIANKNCILFMWVTLPKLNEFMKVVNAWGFEYKSTAFVWCKKNKISDSFFLGLGRWTRANPEYCLLATKGNPKRVSSNVNTLVVSNRREHSRKPDEMYTYIEQLLGGPYIELFARNTRDGWDSWGNEVNKHGNLHTT